MKKLLSMLLICVMLVSLFTGCNERAFGGSTDPVHALPHMLKVGFGRREITPTEKIILRNHAMYPPRNKTYFESALDPIYTSCVAFCDENNNTILLFQNDLFETLHSDTFGSYFATVRAEIAKFFKLSQENVYISATHTYASPSFSGSFMDPDQLTLQRVYLNYVKEQMVAAAKDAVDDLNSAEIFTGSVETSGLLRVYYEQSGHMEDGVFVADSTTGDADEKADNTLQMVRLARTTGQDICLVNFQCHPTQAAASNKTAVSSDYIGVMRAKLEKELNCHVAFFNGAAGNLYPAVTEKTETSAKFLDYVEMGNKLADEIIKLDSALQKVELGSVQNKSNVIKALSLDGKKTIDVSIMGFSIGDVAFALAPYEMFNKHGIRIKEASKFSTTILVSNVNASYGDVPTPEWFTVGGYSVNAASNFASFAKEFGERFTDSYISVLDELYSTRK